ncbi:MAG: ATP-binding protein [Deltaproteobacteria bacterium]|nr:ATP-binding protein [Deltaproteobacteria bacterium]
MYPRLLNILKTNSFFLFGPRGSGKTTLLESIFEGEKKLWIDLLEPSAADRYFLSPEKLLIEVRSVASEIEWVVIDEVQKIPALLDVVHKLIESTNVKFALTGSSARKLKRGGANLLAGRAFIYNLYPLTHIEFGDQFSLKESLTWGTLPRLQRYQQREERERFLESYCHTYLREEVVAEQLVRNVRPFRKFLEIAAQQDGDIINYSKLARAIGVDDKTVVTYYEILEDTLIGIRLSAYDRSLRKQYIKSPKFYLFDCGVSRALANHLHLDVVAGTYSYGKRFEQLVILEIFRLNEYLRKKFQLSYFQSKDGLEIDLVLERPGSYRIFVEIKSSDSIDASDISNLRQLSKEFIDTKCYCLSQVPLTSEIDNVKIMPWQNGIREILKIDDS